MEFPSGAETRTRDRVIEQQDDRLVWTGLKRSEPRQSEMHEQRKPIAVRSQRREERLRLKSVVSIMRRKAAILAE